MVRDDQQFEDDLIRLLSVEAPEALAERVYLSTVDQLTAGGIDQHDLSRAATVAPPEGLDQRVYDATIDELDSIDEAPPAQRRMSVLARIGHTVEFAAIAALVALAVGGGVYLATNLTYQHIPSPEARVARQNPEPLVDLARVSKELSSLDRLLAQPAEEKIDQLNSQIIALSAELDQSGALNSPPITEQPTDLSTDALSDDLQMLESQINAF